MKLLLLVEVDWKAFALFGAGSILAWAAWITKKVIDQGTTQAKFIGAWEVWIDLTSKGAAKILDSPNPTPDHIRILLRKYDKDTLAAEEETTLIDWLYTLVHNEAAPKSERGAAKDLLAGMRVKQEMSFPLRKQQSA